MIVHIQYHFVLVSGYNRVVKQSDTLQSVSPDTSSAHLAPYIFITKLLPTFPMLYFISPLLLLSLLICTSFLTVETITDVFHFLHLFPPPPSPSPGPHHTVVCVHGVCIYVLWLISSPSFMQFPQTSILPCDICQSVPCIHASGSILFIRFHVLVRPCGIFLSLAGLFHLA
uniref:Uncharacterized protein n=1 Tax=Molossus molossus TaxID=27622 RepID=A0A7J8DT50_MOLMO|nr:hypothetical protein HJG59_009112 [Molossus molossus]